MKKVFRTIAMALVMAMMLGITAFAAPKVEAEAGKNVSADITSEKINTLTYTDGKIAKDGQYMIFVVSPDGNSYVPTASSILYINQKQAEGNGTITFENVFPKAMKNSGILVSGTGLTAPQLIAKILAALLGDVDASGSFDVGDATQLLKWIAGLAGNFTPDAGAADVDYSGEVDVGDATYLLKVLAGLAELN